MAAQAGEVRGRSDSGKDGEVGVAAKAVVAAEMDGAEVYGGKTTSAAAAEIAAE